jgi:hypothetical protein
MKFNIHSVLLCLCLCVVVDGQIVLAQSSNSDSTNSGDQLQKIIQTLDGGIWLDDTTSSILRMHERRVIEINNGHYIRKVLVWDQDKTEPDPSKSKERERLKLTATHFKYKSTDVEPSCNPITVDISDNGQTIINTYKYKGKEIVVTFRRVK